MVSPTGESVEIVGVWAENVMSPYPKVCRVIHGVDCGTAGKHVPAPPASKRSHRLSSATGIVPSVFISNLAALNWG